MEADWDLLAVVRGCTSTTAATTTTTTTPPSTTTSSSFFSLPAADLQQNNPPALPKTTPVQAACGGGFSSGCEDLQDLYKPFFPNLRYPISASLAGGFIREQEKLQRRQQPQQRPQPQQILFQQHPQQVKESQVIFGSRASAAATVAGSNISVGSIITSQSQRSGILCAPTTSTSTTSQSQQRSKKRKNLQKRVCHVPAEGLSSDMWAWRKYGQKPIKGSPHPRGYYRCSSSKGCLARKQVERNRSDPKMFIVTYTAEHNHPMPTHRNSLAGSTRQKPATASGETAAATTATTGSPSTNSTGNDHPGSSSPTASLSPTMTDKADVKAEYEEETAKDDSGNEMELPDMVFNDDFFVGFEELDDTDSVDMFSDQIVGSMEMEYPWLCNSSSSTTTAADGS